MANKSLKKPKNHQNRRQFEIFIIQLVLNCEPKHGIVFYYFSV